MNLDKTAIGSFLTGVTVYMATGISLSIGSIYFLTTSDPLTRLLVTKDIIFPSLALGLFIILCSILGYIGAWRPCEYRLAITILSWSIIIVIFYELILGLSIWFTSITPKAAFTNFWGNWSMEQRALVELKGVCCGFSGVNDQKVAIKQCLIGSTLPGCSTYVIKTASDYYISIYTTLFVFILLNFFTLLCTGVLTEVRNEQERYEKGLEKGGAK